MPPWIIRLANYIISDSIRMEFVKECFCEILITTLINVDHDFWAWIISAARKNTIDPGLNQLCEVIPIIRQLSIGPKHSVADFISYLYHMRVNTSISKCHHCLSCILE